MSNFKGWEIVIILVLLLLLFGAKRLPDAARSLGRSMRIFKAETKGLRDDDERDRAAENRATDPYSADNRPSDIRPSDIRPAPPELPSATAETPQPTATRPSEQHTER
jgi:sec-independent protein translocase protein TatA